MVELIVVFGVFLAACGAVHYALRAAFLLLIKGLTFEEAAYPTGVVLQLLLTMFSALVSESAWAGVFTLFIAADVLYLSDQGISDNENNLPSREEEK